MVYAVFGRWTLVLTSPSCPSAAQKILYSTQSVTYGINGGVSEGRKKNPLFWGLKRVKNGLQWLKYGQKTTSKLNVLEKKTILFTVLFSATFPKHI